MSLTARQQRFVDEYLSPERVAALRAMAAHCGLIGGLAVMPAQVFGETIFIATLAVMLDPGAHPVSKAASGLLLECFVPNWREKATPELLGAVVDRDSREMREWRAAVLKRDGEKCTRCGSTVDLHAHHVVRWVDSPDLRVVLENGITVCRPCHGAIHARA